MVKLAVSTGIVLRRFDGEAGAVVFVPGTADTHLLSEAAATLVVQGQQGLKLDFKATALVAGHASSADPGHTDSNDAFSRDSLVEQLLRAGLLIELES